MGGKQIRTHPALLHSTATEPERQPPRANLPGCDARQKVVLVSLPLSEEQLKAQELEREAMSPAAHLGAVHGEPARTGGEVLSFHAMTWLSRATAEPW